LSNKMFKVGRIKYYYDKLGLAIVELDGDLAVGDRIKVVIDNKTLLEQKVESIQIAHKKKIAAKRGEVIGLKTQEKVVVGADVYKG
jgi:hypothetical protein